MRLDDLRGVYAMGALLGWSFPVYLFVNNDRCGKEDLYAQARRGVELVDEVGAALARGLQVLF